MLAEEILSPLSVRQDRRIAGLTPISNCPKSYEGPGNDFNACSFIILMCAIAMSFGDFIHVLMYLNHSLVEFASRSRKTLIACLTKSTLDMLVKLFMPVLGSKQADLSTYGKAGQKIITHLQQLKRDKKKNLAHGRVDLMIELIQQAIDPWLKPLIALRDTVSHYSSQIRIGFSWDGAKGEVKIPMANVSGAEHALIDVMKTEGERLINYSTQFIAGTILCAIPVETHHQPLTDMEKQYVGALWGIDMSRAILKLSSNVIINYTEEHVQQAHKRHLENKAKLLGATDAG